MLIVLASLVALYVALGAFVGVRAGRRDRRASVAQLGWFDPSNGLGAVRAHPHYSDWGRFASLVRDGFAFALSAHKRPSTGDPQPAADASAAPPPDEPPRNPSGKRSRNKKRSSSASKSKPREPKPKPKPKPEPAKVDSKQRARAEKRAKKERRKDEKSRRREEKQRMLHGRGQSERERLATEPQVRTPLQRLAVIVSRAS